MKMNKVSFILMYLIFLVISVISASALDVDVYLFYGDGCGACESMEDYLIELESEFSGMNLIKKEVYNDQSNSELMYDFADVVGENITGVPTVFVARNMFSGYDNVVKAEIKAHVQYCTKNKCEPLIEPEQEDDTEKKIPTDNSDDTTVFRRSTTEVEEKVIEDPKDRPVLTDTNEDEQEILQENVEQTKYSDEPEEVDRERLISDNDESFFSDNAVVDFITKNTSSKEVSSTGFDIFMWLFIIAMTSFVAVCIFKNIIRKNHMLD